MREREILSMELLPSILWEPGWRAMRPRSMRSMPILMLSLVLMTATCACDGVDTHQAGGVPSTSPETKVPVDGPCYDASGTLVAGTGVFVDGVSASFGSATYTFCPSAGVDQSATAADGFFHMLDQTIVDAEPGGSVRVSAPGYLGASLTSTWRIANTQREEHTVQPVAVGDGAWLISVPDREATHILHLGLVWSTGDASYAVTVVVGDSGMDYTSLVMVSPGGDPAISPTLLPEAFVVCASSDVELRFCDPDADYAWLEIGIKPLSDLTPGSNLSWDGGLFPGVITSSNAHADDWAVPIKDQSAVTVNYSGLGDEVIDIVNSIPVFDSQYRAGLCAATSPADMRGVTAMCDLEVLGDGGLVEDDVVRLDQALADAAVLYRYEPVVTGTTAGWQRLLVDPGDDLDELGFNPEAADSGSYEIRGLMIRPLPRCTQDEWMAALARVGDAGFGLEMHLRTEDWNGLL